MRSASWASLLVTEIVMPNTRWPLGCSEKNKERKKERFGLVNNTRIQGHQESWLLKESVEKRSTLTKVKKRKSN
jgi:hypothetical protein